jgi:hypothetical protein
VAILQIDKQSNVGQKRFIGTVGEALSTMNKYITLEELQIQVSRMFAAEYDTSFYYRVKANCGRAFSCKLPRAIKLVKPSYPIHV